MGMGRGRGRGAMFAPDVGPGTRTNTTSTISEPHFRGNHGQGMDGYDQETDALLHRCV